MRFELLYHTYMSGVSKVRDDSDGSDTATLHNAMLTINHDHG